MPPCPCGSPRPFDDCCRPFLDGTRRPETAEQLMRSRYSAFTRVEMDYIRETTLPKRRADLDEAATRAWAEGSEWLGLEILAVDGGGPDDDSGTVEFQASYEQDGEEELHHERSTFLRQDGRWYFVEGKHAGPATFVREQPKVGRNDPCPCGSGKKFKKCCGR